MKSSASEGLVRQLEEQANQMDEMLALGDRILQQSWHLQTLSEVTHEVTPDANPKARPQTTPSDTGVWLLFEKRNAIFQTIADSGWSGGRTLDDPSLEAELQQEGGLDLLGEVRDKVEQVMRQNAQLEGFFQSGKALVKEALERMEEGSKLRNSYRRVKRARIPGLAVDRRG